MSNYDYPSGPRGRPSQAMPPYNDSYQHKHAPQNYARQNQDRGQHYGAYYVEDTPSQPLSPPRSHYARDLDPRQGPPIRPPRPDHSPVTDYMPSPQQRRHQMYQQFFEESPTHHGNGQWADNGYTSPGASRKQQSPQALPHRPPPLGPPPSARRGPPSYYQQDTPHVHPIVEESDKSSAVSSNKHLALVVPTSPRDDSSSIYSGVPSMPPSLHPARENELSPVIADPASLPRSGSPLNGLGGLVRKASIGMKTKPKVTTVKSPDKARREGVSEDDTQTRREFPLTGPGEREKAQTPSQSATHTPASEGMLYPRSQAGSSDALGALSLEVSASDSDEPENARPAAPQRTRSKSPLVPLELRNEAVSPGPTPATPSGIRPGKKRPAQLDMLAVREAEQRGSLTSLPDLIKRATKLASNLDRGKTASRLGMGAWLNDAANNGEKIKSGPSTASNNRRSGGSLTDMLASFPPPAIGTPPQSEHGFDRKRVLSTWSSNLKFSPALPHATQSDDGISNEKRQQRSKQKRRCCGIPLWLLVLLIVIGICLVAAAIVIPVVLVVIPQQRNMTPAANTTSICQQKYSCQNGGASIVAANGNCQCLCINGYTGSTCTDQDRTGCYTVSIGNMTNVTLGSSIPRLISAASTNFSIPLDSSMLLGLFSSAALSCTVQNALVTFNGLSQRDIIEARQATTSAAAAATSDGIVYQNGSPTTSTTLATTTSAAKASATSSTVSNNATTLDFARTAVLFVFQSTGSFNSSYAAQQNFQNFFSSTSGSVASAANSLGLGSGYTADLSNFRVTLPNDTSVGGGRGYA